VDVTAGSHSTSGSGTEVVTVKPEQPLTEVERGIETKLGTQSGESGLIADANKELGGAEVTAQERDALHVVVTTLTADQASALADAIATKRFTGTEVAQIVKLCRLKAKGVASREQQLEEIGYLVGMNLSRPEACVPGDES
jgi:hypothetical protein